MSTTTNEGLERPLDEQREEYQRRRLIAFPMAGTLIWLIIGLAGLYLPSHQAVWVIYFGTGSIAYIGLFLSKFTGENLLDKTKPKNAFDALFFTGMAMALLVFSIAIPFAIENHTSVPMTFGILTGLMWMPLSWILKHPVGIYHTISRTISVLILWYALPDYRFVAIPFAIVAIYLVTIYVLNERWKTANA